MTLDTYARAGRVSPPVIMGILNATPDSFSDGGRHATVEAALTHARAMVAQGASIIDVGGESTRPGAPAVSAEEELARVADVVAGLAREDVGATISIDTSKASVALAALEAGATMVNDVTALGDPAMAEVVAAHGAELILMHMRGDPRTMQEGSIVYGDVVREVRDHLAAAVARAEAAGILPDRVLVDPGIGFGKTTAHNLALTRHLRELTTLGKRVVYGASRKRFLGEVTGRDVGDRDRASAAACVAAVLGGASVLRVHDVAACVDAIKLAAALTTR